jgi:hypothetical protein
MKVTLDRTRKGVRYQQIIIVYEPIIFADFILEISSYLFMGDLVQVVNKE